MTKLSGRIITGSIVAAALAFSLGLPSTASAQGRRVQHMQSMQHRESRQIGQGMRTGRLSQDQARDLQRHMQELQSSIAADRANGRLSPQEARSVKNETKKLEKAINGAESPHNATMPPSH